MGGTELDMEWGRITQKEERKMEKQGQASPEEKEGGRRGKKWEEEEKEGRQLLWHQT